MPEFFDPVLTPFALAFVFTFALVFGVLSSAKVLKFDRRVNAAIAVVFAAFSAMYEPFVTLLQDIMPVAAAFLIILFFVIFLKNTFGEKKKDGEKKEKADLLPLGVSVALLLVVLGAAGDRLTPYLPAGTDPSSVFWLAGILIILLIFWVGYKKGFEKQST